jgi:Zn-dependent M28 family amino/carboxypeptidase
MTVEFHESVVPQSSRVPRSTKIANVVATLRPTAQSSPGRILVVGGHYDSRAGSGGDATSDAPGANDDGSGTAVTMELARVFARHEFDATVVFIAFVGEEQGLLGATQWAEMARGNGWNVEAVLNNDIVGSSISGDGRKEDGFVRVFSEAFSPSDTGAVFRMRNSLGLENDGASRSLARYVNEIGERYVPGFGIKMVYRRDRFLRGGDHSPFHNSGFAAVRFSVAVENYDWQHQDVRTENGKEYGDLTKFMDFAYCANVARVNAAVLATLALAPASPEKAGIVTSKLEYETTLRWQKNKEPDLAGYLVRYRFTTSAEWDHAFFTKDTTATLKLLKDDYLFGIQAVDKEGNASLSAIPRPVR